jgi:hypothetical protein
MLQWGTPYDLEIYKGWSRYFDNITNKQTLFIDNNNTTLILPMAGAGSRFSKQNYENPKPLINVDGLPMIVQAVNCLPDTSKKVFICLDDHVNKYNLDRILKETYSNSLVFSIDGVTQGQACTCEIGINNCSVSLGSSILISACDNGVYYDINKYQKLVDNPDVDVIVWSFRNNPTSRNNPQMYAWLETDENDNILSVSCKKFIDTKHDVKNSHVIIGTMFFRKTEYFMNGLQSNYNENIVTNGEYYVDDVINQSIKQGLNVKVFEVENYICWGTPDDYETYVYWQNFFDKCSWHKYRKTIV